MLSFALAISLDANAWLAFYLTEAGVSNVHTDTYLTRDHAALLQCIAVTNEFLATGARREALVATAKAVDGGYPEFSNDGHFWVGPLGMDFDQEGRLISVAEWETV